MRTIKKRRRGTAIVETDEGILVVASKNKVFLLPGGGANKNETRLQAAVRELREETSLEPYFVKYLFHHVSGVHKSHGHGYFRDYHTIYLVKVKGHPTPKHEIKNIKFYKPERAIHVSGSTREIIDKYLRYKKSSGLKQKQTTLTDRLKEWLGL